MRTTVGTAFLGILFVLASGGIAGAALPLDFDDQTVVTGLTQPSSIAPLPDGRLLISEQRTGNIRLVVEGVLAGGAIYTEPELQTAGSEQGLLGLAVDPGWPGRPYVYIYFDRTPGSVIYISRLEAGGDLTDGTSTNLSLGSRYDILTDIPDNAGNHNGGTLRFGPDGMLYASLGDDANACAAQDSSDLRGVILRLDVGGLPPGSGGPPAKTLITPPGNPFPGGNLNAGLTYAYGLRNPFRFQVDMPTGDLFIGDVGFNSFEELDRCRGGENFGWPFREGPLVRTQGGCTEPGGSGSQTYDDNIGGYSHPPTGAQAIMAGPMYRPVGGGAHTFPIEYDGVVFFAEYYTGFIRAIKETAGNWAPFGPVPGQPDPDNWGTGTSTIADFMLGPEGGLYYLKQFPGELHRIVFTGAVTGVPETPPPPVPLLTANPNPAFSSQWVRLRAENVGTRWPEFQVYTSTGRFVRTLRSAAEGGDVLDFFWDGRDSSGRKLPRGVYFVRLAGTPASARVTLLP